MKKIPFDKFVSIYSSVPRLTIELIAQSPNGILLCKRKINPYKDYWYFPGGTFLFGETIENSIQRISKKELGLEVLKHTFVGYNPYYEEKSHGGFGWAVSLVFAVTLFDGIIKLDYQNSDALFVKNIPDLTIREHKEFIERYSLL